MQSRHAQGLCLHWGLHNQWSGLDHACHCAGLLAEGLWHRNWHGTLALIIEENKGKLTGTNEENINNPRSRCILHSVSSSSATCSCDKVSSLLFFEGQMLASMVLLS